MIPRVPMTTPLPFRPRSSEDWQPYRPIILNLYINDQLKLKDVKEIMERDYGFVASYLFPFPSLSYLILWWRIRPLETLSSEPEVDNTC
jgi:hypothetical protein